MQVKQLNYRTSMKFRISDMVTKDRHIQMGLMRVITHPLID